MMRHKKNGQLPVDSFIKKPVLQGNSTVLVFLVNLTLNISDKVHCNFQTAHVNSNRFEICSASVTDLFKKNERLMQLISAKLQFQLIHRLSIKTQINKLDYGKGTCKDNIHHSDHCHSYPSASLFLLFRWRA